MASSTSTLVTCCTRSWSSSVRPFTASQWIYSTVRAQHRRSVTFDSAAQRTYSSQALVVADVDISTVLQKFPHALLLPGESERGRCLDILKVKLLFVVVEFVHWISFNLINITVQKTQVHCGSSSLWAAVAQIWSRQRDRPLLTCELVFLWTWKRRFSSRLWWEWRSGHSPPVLIHLFKTHVDPLGETVAHRRWSCYGQIPAHGHFGVWSAGTRKSNHCSATAPHNQPTTSYTFSDSIGKNLIKCSCPNEKLRAKSTCKLIKLNLKSKTMKNLKHNVIVLQVAFQSRQKERKSWFRVSWPVTTCPHVVRESRCNEPVCTKLTPPPSHCEELKDKLKIDLIHQPVTRYREALFGQKHKGFVLLLGQFSWRILFSNIPRISEILA